jgi:ribosomal protein S18 acetylase RimI-like enzyme
VRDVAAGALVRSAGAAEAPAVLAVIQAAFGQYRGSLVPESSALAETADTVAAKIARGGAAVVERDGRMLAAILYEPLGGSLYIGRLAVLPQARRAGFAVLLVEAVEAIARARGIPRLTLGVRLALADNIRLFTRLGFRETGREAHPGFTEPTSMNMEKVL